MKDLNSLNDKLTKSIKHLDRMSISSNGDLHAEIDKSNLESLKKEVVKTLTEFKNIIVEYLD